MINLLLEVAPRLGIAEVERDKDCFICPVHEQQKRAYLLAMKYVAMVVFELQDYHDSSIEKNQDAK